MIVEKYVHFIAEEGKVRNLYLSELEDSISERKSTEKDVPPDG